MTLPELKTRLAAAKARLRYHTRPGAGASRTKKSPGEAVSLAKDDIDRLQYLIQQAQNQKP